MKTGKELPPPVPGTYALLLSLTREVSLSIGSLGKKLYSPGCYIYVGSARGPGGLEARIRRHMRPAHEKRAHWHIDSFLFHAKIIEVWWCPGLLRQECGWARTLGAVGDPKPIGFGSSDCRCKGHLFLLKNRADLEIARSRLRNHTDEGLRRIAIE